MPSEPTIPFRSPTRILGLAATLFLAAVLPAAAQQPGTSPVRIFILAGESNMNGKGTISPATTPGTLDYIVANDPTGKYQFLKSGGSYVVRNDVWIRDHRPEAGDLTTGFTTNSALIGPELGFGHKIGDVNDNQILIVKCGVDGTTLAHSFCPPSSRVGEPEPVLSTEKGFYYKEVLRLVNEAETNLGTYFPNYNGGGYEIAGFGWHQGWNDRSVPAYSAAYETNMVNFINNIRNDLGAPNMPFVIATAGMDGYDGYGYTEVEKAQLKMADATTYPAFAGNVAVVDTRATYEDLDFWQLISQSPVSNEGYHWNRSGKTYLHIGLAMGDAMSLIAPGHVPFRLRGSGGPGGVTLTWKNGAEIPLGVRVLRNGVEIAAAAPVIPESFVDAAAPLGANHYEFQFTMPVSPCPPLTLSHNSGITALNGHQRVNGLQLTWSNNLGYTGIQVKRAGSVIAASLPGTATSYIDPSPPAGPLTYSVEPVDAGSTPAEVQVTVSAAPRGGAVLYEPFDMTAGTTLNDKDGGIGLDGRWVADAAIEVTTSGLYSFGSLPVFGNRITRTTSNGPCSINIGPALADAGLLADGAQLWFSFLCQNPDNSNVHPTLALGNETVTYFDKAANSGAAIGARLYQGNKVQGMILKGGGQAGATATQATLGASEVVLVVGRITWGANPAAPDTIDVYTPGTDLVLDTPQSTSAVVDQSGFKVLSMWGNGFAPNLDEIRFGATYQDVIGQGVDTSGDVTPPTPEKMSFANPPTATSTSAITMTASPASDLNGVQYQFIETSGHAGGSSSGWQDSPTYTDTGLDPDTLYTYTVQARDKSVNNNPNTASDPTSATTFAPDTHPPPTPGFATPPAATSSSAVIMTATVVADPEGGAVEYFFTETSGHPGGTSSGWQSSATYTDSGLSARTVYTYTVKARDTASPPNESAASLPASANTPAAGGPGGAVIYEPFNMPVGPLKDQPGGYGLTGNWIRQATSDTNQLVISSPGMTYGTLSTNGNLVENGITSSSRSSRILTGSTLSGAGLLADGATLWFSVLVEPVTSANSTSGFALTNGNITYYDTAGIDGVGVNIQNGSDLEYCAWKTGTTGAYLRSTAQADLHNVGGTGLGYRPHLVVGKITWGTGGGNDTFEIFMPDNALTQGSRKGAVQSIHVDQSSFDRIVLYNQGNGIRFDEVRFGASYEAVIGQGPSGPGPLDHFEISAIASPQTVGTPIPGITLTARDAANQILSGFTGTVAYGGSAGCAGTTGNFTAGVLTGASATPTVAGENLTLTVDDGAGHAGSVAIATVRTRFAAWSGGADFTADANGDDLANGLAWLLGAADPMATDTAHLLLPAQENGQLVLLFRCRKTGFRDASVLKVQYSSTLGTGAPWTSREVVVPDVDGTVGDVVFAISPDADPALVNVRAKLPESAASPAGSLFGRLKATLE